MILYNYGITFCGSTLVKLLMHEKTNVEEFGLCGGKQENNRNLKCAYKVYVHEVHVSEIVSVQNIH